MIAIFKCLKGYHIEKDQPILSLIPKCRMQNNRYKLQEGRFYLDFRKEKKATS